MMKPYQRILALTFTLLSQAAGHDHFAAGVRDLNQNGQPDAGEPLRLFGPDYAPRTFHLLARPFGFRPAQRCGGFYVLDEGARTLFPNDSFSFTALSDGQEESGDAGHARTGAFIWMEITAVKGPAGAKFGFWDVGRSRDHDTPSISFLANEPTGNHAFVISGGYDAIDQDPHGHFHGRAWTADRAGDYRVSFRLVDRSTSGPDGGPWHAPGEVFSFAFKAGPDFQAAGKMNDASEFVLTWPSCMGIWEPYQSGVVFEVLRSSDPANGPWASIGSVTGTTAEFITFTDPSPPAGKAFYRLSYAWSPTEE